RLVIPIRDERGQTLAFTARAVRADEPKKYINSPETPAYIKGRVVFGLDLARDEIARRGHAVMMEGQFDVITAHQFAVTNAVASSGTALTEEQVRLLKRFTDELLLVFDSGHAARGLRRDGRAAHRNLPPPVARGAGGKARSSGAERCPGAQARAQGHGKRVSAPASRCPALCFRSRPNKADLPGVRRGRPSD